MKKMAARGPQPLGYCNLCFAVLYNSCYVVLYMYKNTLIFFTFINDLISMAGIVVY